MVMSPDVSLDKIPHIADDDGSAGDAIGAESIENMPQDRLAGDVKQDLRQRIRMRSKARSDSSDGDYCVHKNLFKVQKYDGFTSAEGYSYKKIHFCDFSRVTMFTV